jgi:energy-coupling factor transporter transmembrane protein EcfT
MQLMALIELLLFCIAVVLISGFVGLLFASITAAVMKGVSWRRRLQKSFVTALPFACLALIVSPFVLQRFYFEMQSLPGSCVLPNGYRLMMTDADSPASVYNPKNESTKASVLWQQDGVDGVRSVQVNSRYILGGRDSHGYAKRGGEVDSYFVLDTKTEKLTMLSSYEQLQSKAAELGVQLRLQAVYAVYQQYGLMRFVPVPRSGRVLVAVVLIALLLRWLLQLWRFTRLNPVSQHTDGEITATP